MSIKQNLFESMEQHLLADEKPSLYFEELDKTAALREVPFAMLHDLKNAEQSPQHHPEGNVWNHTMLVVDEAAKVKGKSSDARSFMWAALLHDVGKPGTTRIRRGKITSYDHDKLGARMAAEFLKQFSGDEAFIEKVTALVRWHMQLLFVVNNLPFADAEQMKRQTSVRDVALLGLCDRLGRLNADREKEEENVRIFLEKTR
ncbi:HDIG domain-containing metalloprotein [Caproiciproducens sp. CPB-2]|uniref:HDIG domain-containing metalloprotein n=1 Tax=Caproiciproducens sp. CPB-2 TaxID=3030017 RepID=UPI0023DC6E6A|nr:HDIG domain-containing metalloprotein [Caproiciproducens sp. CPB-2]MDF1494929.1 HDIG domain-containing protein [Caproiciproducens sp. CPB-2]